MAYNIYQQLSAAAGVPLAVAEDVGYDRDAVDQSKFDGKTVGTALINIEDDIENITTVLDVKGNVLAIDTEEELDDIPKLEGKLILNVPDDTIKLLPNKYYKKTNPTANLTIQFAEDITDVVSEYCIEFVTATDGTAVTLPDKIKWLNGEIPEFENGCIYLISVIRGLGVCAKFV